MSVVTSTESSVASFVQSVPATANDVALAHFAARLAFETDVSDVHADLEAGLLGRAFVLVDSRSQESWDQGVSPAPSTCRPGRSPTAPRTGRSAR